MPAITVQCIELRQDQKKQIASVFTRTLADLTGVPQDRIYVFFDGYTLDNVARGDFIFSTDPPPNLRARYNEKASEPADGV
jgi:phenylpyruvate tautomerase PptA (4-oxalocrotonate tautomerase family)